MKFYAVEHKNDNILKISSSGGVFYGIAKYVLDNNGVCFGAGFDDDFNVIHKKIENTDELPSIMGSKYVQSLIGDTYRNVCSELCNGRLVLFSGTPCQITGLVNYLNAVGCEKTNNLYTMDFICHGCPSPDIWSKYLKSITKGKKVKAVSFRDKTDGWVYFSLKIIYGDKVYRATQFDDIYIQGFLHDLYLRPSCYNCKSKGLDRNSDFTVSDFWGADNVVPDMLDDKGLSMAIINSDKGYRLWKCICDNYIFRELDSSVIKYNVSAIESVPLPDSRDRFFREVDYDDFADIVYHLIGDSNLRVKTRVFGRNIKWFLKRIWRSFRGKRT